MKLEYGTKSLEYDGSGTATATKVTLINSDGAIVPILLPADKISLSNSELFELAIEALYQENFPNRAENEKFSQVDAQLRQNKEMGSSSHLSRALAMQMVTSWLCLIRLIRIQNGRVELRLSLSSKCSQQRATHGKNSRLLKCYNKVCLPWSCHALIRRRLYARL